VPELNSEETAEKLQVEQCLCPGYYICHYDCVIVPQKS